MSMWTLIQNFEDRWYVVRTHLGVREYLYPDGQVIKRIPHFFEDKICAVKTMYRFNIPVKAEV